MLDAAFAPQSQVFPKTNAEAKCRPSVKLLPSLYHEKTAFIKTDAQKQPLYTSWIDCSALQSVNSIDTLTKIHDENFGLLPCAYDMTII